MTSEKFCLRWNDFESNVSSAFRDLRDEKDFYDVTLACEDNNQVEAHKVILSASSPFFKNILQRHKHQHPLLYLRGVKHSQLQDILNFMYLGEASIAQEDLNSFLAVAEDLHIKGLTQGGNNKTQQHQQQLSSKPKKQPQKTYIPKNNSPTESGNHPVTTAVEKPEEVEVLNVKTESQMGTSYEEGAMVVQDHEDTDYGYGYDDLATTTYDDNYSNSHNTGRLTLKFVCIKCMHFVPCRILYYIIGLATV